MFGFECNHVGDNYCPHCGLNYDNRPDASDMSQLELWHEVGQLLNSTMEFGEEGVHRRLEEFGPYLKWPEGAFRERLNLQSKATA